LATISARKQQTGPALDRHRVAHAELVPLQAGLKLIEPIIGQPYRPAVAVNCGEEAVVRHGAVILRAVADREARVEEQSLQADAALCQHGRGARRDFLRRLRRHDEMQVLFLTVVPAVGVVRLERRCVAGLGGIVARQHQPVGRRLRQLVVDGLGVIHSLRAGVAVARGLRPDRFMLRVAGGDRPFFQAGKHVVIVGRGTCDPHEAG